MKLQIIASRLLFSLALASLTLTAQSANGLPSTCKPGDEYLAAATQTKYFCTAANTWTQQATPVTAAAAVTAAAVAPSRDPVLFSHAGAFTQDPTNFIWDSANRRLGLGTNTPADRVDITNGALRVNPGTWSAEAFNLAGRKGIGIPVPYFTPVYNNSIIAFDIYPKGNPTDRNANTGVAWFDICSNDVNLTPLSYECLRMGKFANGDVHVSSAAAGTGLVRNLDLQINGGKVGVGNKSPQSLLSVGASSQFQVNNYGNIVRINNVPVSFPAANAAGYLVNDGKGNLSYTKISPAAASTVATVAVASSTLLKSAALPANPAVGTIARITDGGNSVSDCASGSGTVTHSCEWNGSAWVFSPVGAYVLSSQPGFIPASSASFGAPGIATVAVSESARQYVVAKACRAAHLYLNLGADQPATGNLTITLRVAPHGAPAADTSVSALVPAGAKAGTVISDTTHTADLGAGDLVSIKLVNAAAAPSNLLTVNFSCDY